MKGNVEFTKDDEYYTPRYVIEYFGGNFDYDPATNDYKANEFKIKNYDTIETNCLDKDWTIYKRIWINPPFTRKFEFLKKAVETYKANKDIYIYILIPTESLCTKKFKDALGECGFKLYLPSGRINFESGLGKKTKSPAFSSIVIRLQEKREIEIVDIEDMKGKTKLF